MGQKEDNLFNKAKKSLKVRLSLVMPKIYLAYPERGDIDIYASIVPAKEVGGDLFDFFIMDEKLYFCIGDVRGKWAAWASTSSAASWTT